jgi:hypothetical protein
MFAYDVRTDVARLLSGEECSYSVDGVKRKSPSVTIRAIKLAMVVGVVALVARRTLKGVQ